MSSSAATYFMLRCVSIAMNLFLIFSGSIPNSKQTFNINLDTYPLREVIHPLYHCFVFDSDHVNLLTRMVSCRLVRLWVGSYMFDYATANL